jgi:hypothetical protein
MSVRPLSEAKLDVHELPANDPTFKNPKEGDVQSPEDPIAVVQAGVTSHVELASPIPEKQLDKIFLDLGGAISKERISGLIEGMNRRHLMLHGVKTSELWEHVKGQGVKPLTPEGGNASYWTSGSRAFHNGDEKMTSYDTAFFHYGVGEASPTEVLMSLVIADSAAIPYPGYEPNGYMKLNQNVPKEAACFLRVKLNKQGNEADRKAVGRVEVAMFELLEKIAVEGFTPGELIEVTLPNEA